VRINLHSLRVKLLISLVAVFAFFTAISLATNMMAMFIIKGRAVSSIAANTDQTSRYLSLVFSKAMDLSYALSANANLKTLCNSRAQLLASPYQLYFAIISLDKDIMYNADMNKEVRSVYLYVDAWKKIITTAYGITTRSWVAESAWMRRTEGNLVTTGEWVAYTDTGFGGERLISFFCRPDMINRELRSRAWMSVNFSENSVYSILEGLRLTPGAMVWLIDEAGVIASAADKSQIGAPVDSLVSLDSPLSRSADSQGRLFLRGRPREGFQAVFRRNAEIGWGILAAVPDAELYREQTVFWWITAAVVALILIVLVFYASKVLVSSIDAPVARLVAGMRQAQEGDFSHEIREARRDEFGYLFARYNEMMSRTRRLIRELYEEQLSRKENELKVLQSQINPHFLYNTLDTINWLARANQASDISRIVLSLSTLYRSSFNRGRECIEICEMLRGMESYLFIEKYRYQNLSSYSIDVAEEARGWLVLNLILQPVVENAVIHGIGDLARPGTIRISCARTDHRLHIQVRDDGVGMDAEKLALLRDSLDASGSEDSGLRNVHRRIRLFYGEEYGLSIHSAPDQGTSVDMRVPVYSPRGAPTPAP
jgi:two-component system sensor histidine kinase YesM